MQTKNMMVGALDGGTASAELAHSQIGEVHAEFLHQRQAV